MNPDLKINSSLLDAIMDNHPDVIYIKNTKSEFIKVNKAVLDRFGINDFESLKGKTDFDFFTPEHALQAYADEQQIIKSGKPIVNIEEKETWPDGSISWASTSKMPLMDKKGNCIGTFGISRNITKTKVDEQEIREKTSILNAITSKMPVVIYKFKRNEGMMSFFGDAKRINAFENSKVAKLKISESLNHVVGKVGTQKDKQDYFNFSSKGRALKNEWHFENFIFKGQHDKDEFMGLALDLTEQKIIKQKLKRDAKNLEKVNRELSQFAYIISHDLKAPLRAITNLSEWIEEDLEEVENDGVKENLRLLRNRVGRMENLINGILVYSRVSRADIVYEKLNVGDLIDKVVDSLMVPEKFAIKKASHFPEILFPKVSLEQLFSNLISNVIKYHDKPSGTIEIDYQDVKGFHEFSVSDDGPGIDAEYHEKIFQIFQTLQARDTLESTGVGLSIVKKIVEERGAALELNQKKEKAPNLFLQYPKGDLLIC